MTPQQTLDMLHTLKGIVGKSPIIKITGAQIGVTTITYDAGDVLGNIVEVKDVVRGENGTGIVFSFGIKDLSARTSAINVVVFDSAPTGTFTNGAAPDIADGDIDKIIGVISIGSSDYTSFTDNSVACLKSIGLPVQSTSGNSLWLLFIDVTGAARTTNELSASIGMLQDA